MYNYSDFVNTHKICFRNSSTENNYNCLKLFNEDNETNPGVHSLNIVGTFSSL